MTRTTSSVLMTQALIVWCLPLKVNANRFSSHEELSSDAVFLLRPEIRSRTSPRRGISLVSVTSTTTAAPLPFGLHAAAGDLSTQSRFEVPIPKSPSATTSLPLASATAATIPSNSTLGAPAASAGSASPQPNKMETKAPADAPPNASTTVAAAAPPAGPAVPDAPNVETKVSLSQPRASAPPVDVTTSAAAAPATVPPAPPVAATAAALEEVPTSKPKQGRLKKSGTDGYHEPVYESQSFGTILLHEFIILVLIVIGVIFGVVWQCMFGGGRFRPTAILPRAAHWLVPHKLRRIEDINHLTLIVLFFIGVCLTCFVTNEVYFSSWTRGICAADILGVAFLLLNTVQVYRYIGFYDDRLCSKRKEAALKKREMEESQALTLNEMQSALEQAADSSTGFAERSIGAHKRDFGRFLSWIAAMPKQDAIAVSEGLKEMIKQWLSIFQETSLDPLAHPRDGRGMKFVKVFDSNADIREAAQDLRWRLQEENVSFLAIEKEILQKTRVSIQQKKNNTAATLFSRLRERVTLPSWVTCGCVGLGCPEVTDQETFVVKMCCCKLTIISQGHCLLLSSLVFGIVLEMYLLRHKNFDDEESAQNGSFAMQSGVLVFVACLFLIAWNFDPIQKLLKLEGEIEELGEARERLDQQRLRIYSLFGQTQMHEFWLKRTIPLLDLMKEMQERFRDSAEINFTDAAKVLPRSCFVMSEVLRRAGTADEWMEVLNMHSGHYSDSTDSDDKVAGVVQPSLSSSGEKCLKAPKEIKALSIWTQQIAAESDRNIRTMTARMESRIPALISSTAHFFGGGRV